ncbi:MAG: 6-carboxytetrahydropterin synthase [Elusimicrobiaceae bacterium]|nr:6-carboxytetrahydropterin synthase [Elusimicrobiaceae bacterium]
MKKIYLTQCASFTARHGHGGALAEESHTHHFQYQVTFYGALNPEGFLIDFRVLQDFLNHHIHPRLEQADLNTLLPQPTTENLAIWIFEQVQSRFPQVCCVRVAEEPDRWAEYKGED